MSTTERADRGRDEPIDVEFEPAEREYRGSRGISGTSAIALAIVAAGVGAAGGAVAPRLPQVNAALDETFGATTAPQAAASADAGQLDTRLDRIEAIMNAPLAAAASGEVGEAGTAARVFAMQAGLRDVETRLSQMPSTEQVTALVAEVRAMQEQLPAIAAEARQASIASRAAFALTATTEASSTSGPFEQSYASLQALLPEDPNVVALAPLARTGAPTRAELRDRFERIDNDIIRAARESQAGAGFWGRIQAALAQWIIVRQSGEGDTPAGVVERASQRLAADDLAGAIQEVNRLSGAAKRVAQPWLNDAQRRLEIDRRLAAIRTELSRGA
ncbi:MAG: mitofilin family membrane protein [Hyphomonadaceae bacterium]|nr:mitofilin family membrane protein [Hyphomonadaceae bacterium]